MTFAQTIDPRWHRRRSDSRRIGKRGVVQPPHPSYHDHAHVVRALPFSDGIATLSHPTAGLAGVFAEQQQQQQQQPYRIDKRGAVPPPPRRVEHAPFARLDDLKGGTTAADVPAGMAPAPQCGRGQEHEGGAKDWREGLLGYGARVLALSVYPDKRELLCDRKDPYLHLTPRRLAITVIKSGFVVAAPMVNQVILENLDEDDDDHPPPPRAYEGGGGGAFAGALGGFGPGGLGVYYDTQGRLVLGREEGAEGEGEGEDVMKSLSKSFELFPALTFRRVLHSVMTVSTQRLLEWQAVMHLSARTADRLTKNIALSALRKTERMSRGMAAAKMTLTAGKALFFQNLALFMVDELFLAVRVGLRERSRRKQNPYSCTDWAAVLREMREKSLGNFSFAFCIWVAGTLGTVVGTMAYPARGPELLSILAEMGASALLN